jgi:hypothetical protein
MKKFILILSAVAGLVLAGCNQGGTSDQYGTSSGKSTNNWSRTNNTDKP